MGIKGSEMKSDSVAAILLATFIDTEPLEIGMEFWGRFRGTIDTAVSETLWRSHDSKGVFQFQSTDRLKV